MSTTIDSYFKDVSRTRLLTREEEVLLSQRIEKGDKSARDIMIESNLRLAISIAKKYSRGGGNLPDLIQESNIGLMKAVDRYDWRRGFKFSTYASWWIRQSVTRHLCTHGSTVRIPSHTSGLIYKISRVTREYSQEFGQNPTSSELADLLNVSESLIKVSLESMTLRNMLSIDASINNDSDNRRFAEVLADPNSIDPNKIMDRQKIMDAICECLGQLSEREEKILRLRFGIVQDLLTLDDLEISESETNKIKLQERK